MVSVTEQAAEKMKDLLVKQRWQGYGLRFGIRDQGCSGYSYLLEFQQEPASDDLVYEEHGVRVFVAPDHLPMLTGSVIGWKDALMETGFDVDNPNAKRPCGCGSSFDV